MNKTGSSFIIPHSSFYFLPSSFASRAASSQALSCDYMTPSRLTKLECPKCNATHWTIDSDYRGMDGIYVAYDDRQYTCPRCQYVGSSFGLLDQSPPEFLLQPHQMYPMTQRDFDYWLAILQAEFPNELELRGLGRDFRPNTRVHS